MSANVRVTPVVVPQVNVNDDSLMLVRWQVESGATVTAGDAICDVETTKAASEMMAPATGVLVHRVAAGTRVAVGQAIAAIGPDQGAVVASFAAERVEAPAGGAPTATPKAKALAEEHGVSLEGIRRSGVRGTIKESDVKAFLAKSPEPLKGSESLAAGLDRHLVEDSALSAFDIGVATSLRRAASQLILTSVDMDCRLTEVHARVKQSRSRGVMLSALHAIISAVARALPDFPRLTSVAHQGKVFLYRSIDVAFVARMADGRLFTPVLRNPAAMSEEEIAKATQAATLRAARGTLTAAELEGAAFTISQVPVPGTTRVVALPSFGQSSILGVSAERDALELHEGVVRSVRLVTLTLNYDHALCDGVYAANFLAAIVKDVESKRS